MNPCKLPLVMVALAVLSVFEHPVLAQETERTWTDSSGKHRIKATMLGVEGDEVELEKPDGSTVKLKIDRLSKTDQRYVENRRGGAGPKTDKPSIGKRGEVEIDTSEAVKIRIGGSGLWSLEPDISEPLPESYSSASINLGISGTLVNTQAVLSRNGELAIFSDDSTDFQSRFSVVNLVSGTLVGSASLDMTVARGVHDVTPDGLNILTGLRSWGQGADNGVKVVELRNGKPVERIEFVCHPNLKIPDNGLHYCRFIDNERVITCNRIGTIGCWDFRFGKLLWWLDTDSDVMPGMSSNGRYLVAFSKNRLIVVDLQEGDVTAVKKVEEKGLEALAISPDGKHIAGAGNGLFRLWDFATGEKLYGTSISSTNIGRFEWPDNRHVTMQAMGTITLVDTVAGLAIDRFSIGLRGDYVVDGMQQLWHWDPSENSQLQVHKFPRTEIQAKIKGKTAKDFVVLESGDSVNVEYGFQDYRRDVQADIKSTMERLLRDAGYRISSSATKTLYVYAGVGEKFKDEEGRSGRRINIKVPGFRHNKTQFFGMALYDNNGTVVWGGPSATCKSNECSDGGYFRHIDLPEQMRISLPLVTRKLDNPLGGASPRGGFSPPRPGGRGFPRGGPPRGSGDGKNRRGGGR